MLLFLLLNVRIHILALYVSTNLKYTL
jgi:hypothetical protein